MKREIGILTALVCVLAVASSAMAAPVVLGEGNSSATVVIEWSDGFNQMFPVAFDDNTTGLGLLETIDTELGDAFTLTTTDWGWGISIDGIEFVDGDDVVHYNPGWDAETGFWWQYFTKDSFDDTVWTESFEGAADRVVTDGMMDGWSYGSTTVVPEPALMGLMLAGFGLVRSRKRKSC